MNAKPTEKLSTKNSNNEESQPKLYLVTEPKEHYETADQLSKSEESEKAKRSTPRKPTNKSVREREYLTRKEVNSLTDAAKSVGRYGKRDALMIQMAYRHGLRVGELVNLRWTQIDFEGGRIHINRLKRGDASVQPLDGAELRALRALQRTTESAFLFSSERGACLTPRAFQLIIARAGRVAGLTFPVHPHQLRHATGYALANAGTDTRTIQAYLGHKNIQHTCVYTTLASDRFKNLEKAL